MDNGSALRRAKAEHRWGSMAEFPESGTLAGLGAAQQGTKQRLLRTARKEGAARGGVQLQ